MILLLASCMLVYDKVCNVYISAETLCASMYASVCDYILATEIICLSYKIQISTQLNRKCPYAYDTDAQNRCRKVTPHEGLLPRCTPTCPPNVVGPLVCSNFTWAPFGCTPKFQSVPSFCWWGCCSGPGKGTGILASGLKLQNKKFNDFKISFSTTSTMHVYSCMQRWAYNCSCMPWNNNGNPACITAVTILNRTVQKSRGLRQRPQPPQGGWLSSLFLLIPDAVASRSHLRDFSPSLRRAAEWGVWKRLLVL